MTLCTKHLATYVLYGSTKCPFCYEVASRNSLEEEHDRLQEKYTELLEKIQESEDPQP